MTTQQPFHFQRRGLLMVISAPSGGGKSEVLRRLLEREQGVTYSVSVTSRAPRKGEVDGRDYHFVTEDQFRQMVREDKFYEWAEVHGSLYGTREETVQQALAKGQDVVMDIDVKGGISVKWRAPDAVLVFLMPPSMQVLEDRLRGRASDNEDAIRLRLRNAQQEIQHWRLYDYVVSNDVLEDTVKSVAEVLRAERRRASRLYSPPTEQDDALGL